LDEELLDHLLKPCIEKQHKQKLKLCQVAMPLGRLVKEIGILVDNTKAQPS
jgi:hypothetical protein